MRTRLTLFQAVVSLLASLAGAQPLGEARMEAANKAASEVVRKRMSNERPDDAKVLDAVVDSDIVVVRGAYDRVEDVLRTLQIKHTVVDAAQVGRLSLNARQLLIVNCAGNLDAAGIDRVRRFVNAGGYLYTTDWALTEVVQKAFPGFIAFNGRQTGNDVVEVEVKQTDNNLLKHLTLSKDNPKWWLESSSYPIKVLDPKKVDVLVTSSEMGRKYGETPIAVHFRYGDGQVLHIASHFYLQQNQTRTVAEAGSGKDYVKGSALSEGTKKALEKTTNFSDDVVAGDLNSAYAAQQMTSNIVVERKKDQGRIDSLYSSTVKAPTGAAPVPVGSKVKRLETKGDQVKVRTMTGDEVWLPASSL